MDVDRLYTQQQLLHRLRADDKAALQEIFQDQYQKVCGAIFRLIKDAGIVEDLAQEVFFRFWQKRHQIEITSSLDAYLRRMAVNEGLAYLRSRKYFTEEIEPHAAHISDMGNAEDRFLHAELEQNIRSAIDGLPPKCRMVFQLSRYEELSYQEIATQMGISIKTVENQMGKALKILRQELQGYLHLLLLIGLWQGWG
jgi:RNA polymerase sigma-70 factor (ECF subfamily)